MFAHVSKLWKYTLKCWPVWSTCSVMLLTKTWRDYTSKPLEVGSNPQHLNCVQAKERSRRYKDAGWYEGKEIFWCDQALPVDFSKVNDSDEVVQCNSWHYATFCIDLVLIIMFKSWSLDSSLPTWDRMQSSCTNIYTDIATCYVYNFVWKNLTLSVGNPLHIITQWKQCSSTRQTSKEPVKLFVMLQRNVYKCFGRHS